MVSGLVAPPSGVTDDPLVWIDCEVRCLSLLGLLVVWRLAVGEGVCRYDAEFGTHTSLDR